MVQNQWIKTVARRFKREVEVLKAELIELNIELKPFEEANDNDICIISTNDYNLADKKENCDSNATSYFVTEPEYAKYIDEEFGD